MLHFLNFKKKYGSLEVLNIEENFFDSGLYWIKGKNGSGKSTLLKAIGGIVYFEGDLLLNNFINIKKHPVAYRRKVNLAEAEPNFPPFLKGYELIHLFVSAKNAPKGQEKFYIESMNMESYLHHPIGSYSSGMIKKLSLVLAFLGHPQLILLDEPLNTLDQESLKVLYRWIEEKHEKEGTSFFLSSHQSFDSNVVPALKTVLLENHTLTFPS